MGSIFYYFEDGPQVLEEPEVRKEAQQEERWKRKRGRVDFSYLPE